MFSLEARHTFLEKLPLTGVTEVFDIVDLGRGVALRFHELEAGFFLDESCEDVFLDWSEIVYIVGLIDFVGAAFPFKEDLS